MPDTALAKEDGDWKLDRLVGFERFDRAKFERAYWRLLLQSGSPADAADCGLGRTRRLSNRALERAFLEGTAQRVFARIGVSCDRAAVFAYLRRGLVSYDDLDAGTVACVLAGLKSRPRAAAIRLTYDKPRYEQLIEACGRR